MWAREYHMNFLPEPGILLDTIQYNVYYFNPLTIKYREASFTGKERESLLYFDSFSALNRSTKPTQRFYPFFCYSLNKPLFASSPLIGWLGERYDALKDNPKVFFRSLCCEDFKAFCFTYFIKNSGVKIDVRKIISQDTDSFVWLLSALSVHGSNLIYFAEFFTHFETLVGALAEYLIECYGKMETFHSMLAPELMDTVCAECAEYEESIKQMLEISARILMPNELFTIQLMDHFSFQYKKLDNNKLLFFIGASSSDTIRRWRTYGKTTISSFVKSIGNETKLGIIQKLLSGEKTVSQLSRELFIAHSTIDRYIKQMCGEEIVNVSNKRGVEIYYNINRDYFIITKKLVIDFFERCVGQDAPVTGADSTV
jgi:hypothetical protein